MGRIRNGLLSVALIFGASACGTDRGLDPVSTVGLPSDPGLIQENRYFSQVVGPTGGTMDGGNSILTVQSGALQQSVTLTMETSSPGGDAQCVLTPTSQTFGQTATLSMEKPANSLPGQVFHIFEWSETTQEWVDRGGLDDGDWVSVVILDMGVFGLSEVD